MKDKDIKLRLKGVMFNHWDRTKSHKFDETFESVSDLEDFIAYNRNYFKTVETVKA